MKLVKESLINEEEVKRQTSAGLAIIQNGTILLGHPTGQKWYGTYSIPKGMVEEGEDLLEAAIRETKEEMGIEIDPEDIQDTEPRYIDYKDKSSRVYKRVYYFIVKPSVTISSDAIEVDKDEIDWAGFILKDKAKERIYWRLKEILDHVEDLDTEESSEENQEESPPEESEFGL